MTMHYAYIFDDPSPCQERTDAVCDHVNCLEEGSYRAPKSREGGYFHFCLEHVRTYNASWNYYQGIPDNELEKHIQDDVTWQRPSWPLHARAARTTIYNTFGFEELREHHFQQKKESDTRTKLPCELHAALKLLDLGYPFTKDQLKREFRMLVKKYHPDANNDDPHCKEMMKKINAAYACLKMYIE